MDPEIEVTSAAEAPEIELRSAAEAPEIEVTSATEAPDIEVISAAEALEIEVTSTAKAPEIEVTSAAEAPEIEMVSAAEVLEIEVTSASEAPEFEVTSAAEGLEVGRTSSALHHQNGLQVGGKSSVLHHQIGQHVGGTASALHHQNGPQVSGTASAPHHQIGPQVGGKSSALHHQIGLQVGGTASALHHRIGPQVGGTASAFHHQNGPQVGGTASGLHHWIDPQVGGTASALHHPNGPQVGGTTSVLHHWIGPQVGGTASAFHHQIGPQVGRTASALHHRIGPQVGGTASAFHHQNGPQVGGTASGLHHWIDPQVGGTTSALHHPNGPQVGGTASVLHHWIGPQVGGTASALHHRIGPQVGGTASALHHHFGPQVGGTASAFHHQFGPQVGGTASALHHQNGPDIYRNMEYFSTSASYSIFIAPLQIRYGRESDFEPKLISIGPYYRGRPKLQPMEETKVWCMSSLLTLPRAKYNGGINMGYIPVEPFMQFARPARSFYEEKFNRINDYEFVQMLILDSCLVIGTVSPDYGVMWENMGLNIKEVRSDLLLMGNQIPLFFINLVYNWLFPYRFIDCDLDEFVNLGLPWEPSNKCRHLKSDHLLDLYWKSSLPKEIIHEMKRSDWLQQKTDEKHIIRSLPKLIANATELHQIAGIKFESRYYKGLQVEFSKGIMRMRCLKIDSSQATSLVNLIAFETSKQPSVRLISTYIKFLDDLIDSEKDVELLQKSGVIYNTLSSHTMAATFFNDIGNLCLIHNYKNPFFDFFTKVDQYYESRCNRRWASLKNNYFNSPWAGISVFAGVMLLILTVLQTFYTIYGYYHPRN